MTKNEVIDLIVRCVKTSGIVTISDGNPYYTMSHELFSKALEAEREKEEPWRPENGKVCQPEWVSKCCGASYSPAKISPSEGDTNYWMCDRCHKPTDAVPNTEVPIVELSPNQHQALKREILNEIADAWEEYLDKLGKTGTDGFYKILRNRAK